MYLGVLLLEAEMSDNITIERIFGISPSPKHKPSKNEIPTSQQIITYNLDGISQTFR